LDNEPIEKRKKYLGRRIKRGLFKTSNGTIINADVNSGYNIIIKGIPNAFADGIEDAELHPCSLNWYK
jgi:putative transposase